MYENLFIAIGKLTVLIIFIVIIILVFLSSIIFYYIATKKILFPKLFSSLLLLFYGILKAVFRFFGTNDIIIDKTYIYIQNNMNIGKIKKIHSKNICIFFPQCLRSVKCPAKSTGGIIECINCGRCEIGKAKQRAEKFKSRFFVITGGSVVKRLIKKNKPKAIIGVGCLFELKQGLELCAKYNIPGYGICLLKDGCVNTILDWDEYYNVFKFIVSK